MKRHLDCLSFFEVETVVKKFGYQPGDLIYYREPGKELDDRLVLMTFNEDVVKMAEVFLGHKLVVVDEVCLNVGEVEEDEERRRKAINDQY